MTRRFGFFEKLPFLDESNCDSFPVFPSLFPTSLTASCGKIWLGDSDGVIYRCDRLLKVDSFRAHFMPVSFVRQTKPELLITVAIKEDPIENQLKLWNIKKWSSRTSPPTCIRTININPTNVSPSIVTALDISSDFKCFLFGHSNGLVQLIKGDLTKERGSKRFILKQLDTSISFIGTSIKAQASSQSKVAILKRDKTSEASAEYTFYIVSQSSIYCVKFVKDEVELENKLEDFGCLPGEAAMFSPNSSSLDLAVAYQDAIFFYNIDGRGPCIANTGRKYLIRFFRNYLILVKSNKTSKETGEKRLAYQPSASTILQIIDHQNKFIAAEFEMPFVFDVFSEWQGLFVVLADPRGNSQLKIYSLLEKDTSAKLDILFSKQHYQLAEELAKSQQFTQEELAHIYKHGADYLFERKDFDAAAIEYAKTIGHLEPSYVIQKFLDCNQIEPVAFYLEQLIQDAQICTGHHVLLLINCYTRIGDTDRLTKFVQNFQASEKSLNNFDISSAIRVLRQTGYPNQALDLALAASQMEDAVLILMEDLKDAKRALQIIQKLPFDLSLKCICAHGHILMSELPNETGHFLEMLVSNPDANKIDVHHFLKIFVDNREGLLAFLDRYISNPSAASSRKIASGIVDTFLELLLYDLHSNYEYLSSLTMKVLLNDHFRYDVAKALILCKQRSFFQGCIHLWKKQQHFDRVLEFYIDQDDKDKALETCENFGKLKPEIWLILLRYLLLHHASDQAKLKLALEKIEEFQLATPIEVVEMLASSDICTIGSIREYLEAYFEHAKEEVDKNRAEVQKLREETHANQQLVRKLNSQVMAFQQQKCHICHESLNMPSIYFLCEHSYHRQ